MQVTGRRIRVFWYCGGCNSRNDGNVRLCVKCGHDSVEKHAQVHAQERAVVYQHPLTGEIRRPMAADQPMHPKYQAAGFERVEIMNMTRHERETGSVHEPTNWNPGNEPMPEDPRTPKGAPKEVIDKIVNEVRAAHQSGNWTMDRPLSDVTVSEE